MRYDFNIAVIISKQGWWSVENTQLKPLVSGLEPLSWRQMWFEVVVCRVIFFQVQFLSLLRETVKTPKRLENTYV